MIPSNTSSGEAQVTWNDTTLPALLEGTRRVLGGDAEERLDEMAYTWARDGGTDERVLSLRQLQDAARETQGGIAELRRIAEEAAVLPAAKMGRRPGADWLGAAHERCVDFWETELRRGKPTYWNKGKGEVSPFTYFFTAVIRAVEPRVTPQECETELKPHQARP